MITLYFTGTGNSLAVAKRIGGTLISIPQEMRRGRDLTYSDDAIGLVYPLYSMNPPKMVREFLKVATFDTDYLFSIGTYGNLAGASPYCLQERVAPYGKSFDYATTVKMVDNFLPSYDMADEMSKIGEKGTEADLAKAISDIAERKREIPVPTEDDWIYQEICDALLEKQDRQDAPLTYSVNDSCVACGICAKVCPADNIIMDESGPRFELRCESCYACLNACPKNALHKSDEKTGARYRHPDVSLAEIIASNSR